MSYETLSWAVDFIEDVGNAAQIAHRQHQSQEMSPEFYAGVLFGSAIALQVLRDRKAVQQVTEG